MGSSYFDRLPHIAYDLLPNVDECNAAHAVLHLPHVGRLKPLINHFFVPNPAVNGTGVSPRFNLAHHTSFVTTKKVAVSRAHGEDSSLNAHLFVGTRLSRRLWKCSVVAA